ncbi:DnaJ family domain-containing protein [Paenibacillus pini]|uniref:Cytoplasmic protein n=1 Tax=Paenibacillus pini JCM 16418 TaxID=1236976 RepID=W7YTE4_9BACL|nr:DnaJ family domain-containing protein [Paenibacillus pini]GAF07896.1 cytoplasmic protein [Paenibacillus pini JCM 16418]
MGIMDWLAEQKIKDAMEQGEFNHLPGQGKPLYIEDLSHIPPELRVPYKIMKNAGLIPDELALQGDCLRLENLINLCMHADEKEDLQTKLNEKRLRLQRLAEERGWKDNTAFREYEQHITNFGKSTK